MRSRIWLLTCLVGIASGCGGNSAAEPVEEINPADSGTESENTDSSADSASHDTGLDSSGKDSTADVTKDTSADTSKDTSTDTGSDSSADAKADSAGGCTVGAKQCSGKVPETCDSKGKWQSAAPCPYLCSAGECSGECIPASKRCSGKVTQECDLSGTWIDKEACPFVCVSGACSGACIPSTTQCNLNVVQNCGTDGKWYSKSTCPFACNEGVCVGQCIPASKQCLASAPQTCDSLGAWQTGGTCSDVCNKGVCEICPANSHACSNACVASSSVTTCGSSCVPCPSVTHGTASCDGKACGYLCDTGYQACATGCCPWIVETIATQSAYVEDASLAFDKNGNLHIVYWSQVATQLLHAQNVNGNWSSKTILTGTVSTPTDLVVDLSGVLHLAWRGQYLTYSAGGWSPVEWFTGVDKGSAYGPTLGLDSKGGVHVAYVRNDTNASVQYSSRTTTGWVAETVGKAGAGYPYNDVVGLLILPSDLPAITYRGTSAFQFTTKPQTTWIEDALSTPTNNYSTMTMQQDAQGLIHVAYASGYGNLQQYVGKSGNWNTAQGASGWGRFAHSETGDLVIAYVEKSTNPPYPLRLMRYQAGAWNTSTIAMVSDGSSVDHALVKSDGSVWVLVGGYQALKLYH